MVGNRPRSAGRAVGRSADAEVAGLRVPRLLQEKKTTNETGLMAVALLLLAAAALAREKQAVKSHPDSAQLEGQVRKLWEAFKQKAKATVSAMLDDGFRHFEEGLNRFGVKKTEVNAPDQLELLSYTLSDFTGPNAPVVTYIAQHEVNRRRNVQKEKAFLARSGLVEAIDGKISTCKKHT